MITAIKDSEKAQERFRDELRTYLTPMMDEEFMIELTHEAEDWKAKLDENFEIDWTDSNARKALLEEYLDNLNWENIQYTLWLDSDYKMAQIHMDVVTLE